MNKKTGKAGTVLTSFILVLAAAMFAIMVHILMPGNVDIEKFDSILVKFLGFPVVASLYFILLYSHITFVIRNYGYNDRFSVVQTGFRFGISFAFLYLIGMQEIVMDSSPYQQWGSGFVIY